MKVVRGKRTVVCRAWGCYDDEIMRLLRLSSAKNATALAVPTRCERANKHSQNGRSPNQKAVQTSLTSEGNFTVTRKDA